MDLLCQNVASFGYLAAEIRISVLGSGPVTTDLSAFPPPPPPPPPQPDRIMESLLFEMLARSFHRLLACEVSGFHSGAGEAWKSCGL